MKGKYARRRAARLERDTQESVADYYRRVRASIVTRDVLDTLAVEREDERVADCHICGEPIDHCSGHSEDERVENPHPDDIDTGEWRRTLEACQVARLREIAQYHDVKYTSRTRKTDLIDAIIAKVTNDA